MNDYVGLQVKQISFNGSHGTDEEQLQNLLKLQTNDPPLNREKDSFKICGFKPVADIGHRWFWIFYTGKFPEEKEYWNKK